MPFTIEKQPQPLVMLCDVAELGGVGVLPDPDGDGFLPPPHGSRYHVKPKQKQAAAAAASSAGGGGFRRALHPLEPQAQLVKASLTGPFCCLFLQPRVFLFSFVPSFSLFALSFN